MAPKKPATKKRVYKRKAPMKSKSMVPRDGTNLLCTAYFEIQNQQTAAVPGKLSYSLKLAPEGLVLTNNSACVGLGADGVSANKGDNSILIANASTTGEVPLTRFSDFASIYRQYRINSASVSVIVDRDGGLENPICFSCSKASPTPHADMGTIVGGAHKQYTMTESRRTAKYGFTARATEDKEFRMSSATLAEADAQFIKIFQECDAKANSVMKHRVSVSLNLTLKDSSKN